MQTQLQQQYSELLITNLSTAADPTNVAYIQNGVNSVFRLAAIVSVIGLVLVIFIVRPKMTAKKAE